MPLIFFSIPTCHFRDDHELTDDQKHAVGAIVIVGAVYVIGKEERSGGTVD